MKEQPKEILRNKKKSQLLIHLSNVKPGVCHILVHDQNTPGDGPLLGADETTTLGGRRKLRDVDRDLSGLNSDTETVDNTSGDEHTHVLGSADNNGADNPNRRLATTVQHQLYRNDATMPPCNDLPNNTTNHNSILATKTIRNETRDESTEPRTTGHGSGNTTLSEGAETTTDVIVVEWRAPRPMIEITLISRRADNGRHRRDIETEQCTANDGHRRDGVEIPHDKHGDY